MKIGIEGQRLFRTKKHGMDMVALELIKNLQIIDHENEYVIFIKPGDDPECLKETKNFKIVELEGGSYPFWEQKALPKAAFEQGCDLLHCTSNTAPINSKVPIITTLHDIIYLESISIFKKGGSWYQKIGNMYRRYIVPKVVKSSKKIITVSKFERDRIKNFFKFTPDDNRVVAVYNGVSTHFKTVTDKNILNDVKNRYNLPEHYFFFLGNTDPKKNTKGVLEAYSAYRKETKNPSELVMLDFDQKDLESLLSQIGDKELINHIHLTGYVINTDLPAIYTMCEIFLYPSLRESFGIPMLEAMGCGTPVITSNTSSMPEVSGGAAKIVDPYKPIEIKDAIIEILNNSELANTLIEKGYKRAAEFTWRAMAENVLELYKEIVTNTK
ncbi:MAG: glycosyltransferase family 1 protein [Bacteroidota bacterium]|nr:glycosyltransferase family 1 protein [Bacteroidota bacterium]